MYLYPGKREVKRKVRFLRQLWHALQMEVKTTLKKIVDPVAMSLVILEEGKKLARRVRKFKKYILYWPKVQTKNCHPPLPPIFILY